MAMHEVNVVGFSERQGDYFTAESTLGGIVVKPPVMVGGYFYAAVLGSDQYGVDLFHVVTTPESTVFLAKAGAYGATSEDREATIKKIRDRIELFVDSPEKVIERMDENPFPLPEGRSRGA